MTVEQAWAKWEPYWPLRQNGPNCLPYGDTYVLGRYGDEGEYTVDNCRVITHRANTLERDHTKCADKLRGTVHNPAGGRTVPKHRRHNGDRRVVTPRGEFEDCAKAAQAYGMHRSSVWHRVNSDRYPDFHWRSFA
jgi:hypothetical protein